MLNGTYIALILQSLVPIHINGPVLKGHLCCIFFPPTNWYGNCFHIIYKHMNFGRIKFWCIIQVEHQIYLKISASSIETARWELHPGTSISNSFSLICWSDVLVPGRQCLIMKYSRHWLKWNEIKIAYHSDVTWAQGHLNPLATWLFVQHVQLTKKENIKELHYLPFLKGITVEMTNNVESISILEKGSFCVCVQPMRDDDTM